ncbi:MAG TPA: OstA-like protein [Flavilitoribacter sp.]|nr:OstA-like protein [Flavilitoribacter sp.]
MEYVKKKTIRTTFLRLPGNRIAAVVALLLAFSISGGAQSRKPGPVSPPPAAQDTARTRVDVDHADVLEYLQKRGRVVQKLIGHVELSQDSVYMYCDSATIENGTRVVAMGHVLIQHGDSLSVFSDSLVYNSETRIADLFGEVILLNNDQKLFTNRLNYDLNTKIATYQDGATLTSSETQLTSRRGYYYVDQREAYFKDSVLVVDPKFTLRSDTLLFNAENKIVHFLGPTVIGGDSTRIYCEAGFYDTANNLAEFRENAQYAKGDQKATAETIRYNGELKEYTLDGDAYFEDKDRVATAEQIRYFEEMDKTVLNGKAHFKSDKQDITADEIVYDGKNEVYSTKGRSRISEPPNILEADAVAFREDIGLGIASGNVIWQDTSAQTTIFCEDAAYNRETGYLKASGGNWGRPLMVSVAEADSMYMAADTLISFRSDSLAGDSSRILLAYHDVRIYKSDLQALCDSLTFSSVDSLFRFYRSPIIWSDTTQFTGDTIFLQMANREVDQIFLKNNSFIINSPDERFFNQIKGKYINARFREGELRVMDVQGNAESVYYARDDSGGYVGVNKTICSDMVLYFGSNQVEKIKFLNQPKATMSPMTRVDHNELKIKGFNWDTRFRPQSKEDLFGEDKKRAVR